MCPFCGCDPFHYEHNGLGMERVAVNCCDFGCEFYSPTAARDVTMERAEFVALGMRIIDLRTTLSRYEDAFGDLPEPAET